MDGLDQHRGSPFQTRSDDRQPPLHLLAGHDPVHQRFVQAEKSRQRKLEASPKRMISPGGRQPWVSATWCRFPCSVGLSSVELSAGPSGLTQAKTAPRVRMQVRDGIFASLQGLCAPGALYPSRRSSILYRRKAHVPRRSPGRWHERRDRGGRRDCRTGGSPQVGRSRATG